MFEAVNSCECRKQRIRDRIKCTETFAFSFNALIRYLKSIFQYLKILGYEVMILALKIHKPTDCVHMFNVDSVNQHVKIMEQNSPVVKGIEPAHKASALQGLAITLYCTLASQ